VIEYTMKALAAKTARRMTALAFCDGAIVVLHLY
jgi:hypothetical protein